MKKFKKLGKVWNVVAIIMTFVVTFSVVYATGTYFYQRYGTPGALSDKVLTNTEWDALMEELDTFSCPEQECSQTTCPDCEGTRAYLSPNGKVLRKNLSTMPDTGETDDYDRFLYTAAGEKLLYSVNNYAGQCPGGGTAGSWSMNQVYINNSNSKFCAHVSQCADVVNKSYFVHSHWNWIEIKFDNSCNNNQITFTTNGIKGSLGNYSVSMGNGTDVFYNNHYLVINP